MYESKGGLYVVSTSTADDFLRLISRTSFDIWPQNQWVQSNFQSFSLLRPQAIANSRKFRCFKNRTAAHGCEFLFTMLWSLLHLISEGKMQNHLEATRSIWTLKLPLCSEPVCHSHQFSRPGLTSPILDSRSSILASLFPILDSQFSILHSRFSILDPRSRILDPRFPLLDPRYWNLASRFSIRMEGPLAHTLVRYRETLSESWENTTLLPEPPGTPRILLDVPCPPSTWCSHTFQVLGGRAHPGES